MVKATRSDHQRCFISAPFGLDLGILPNLLSERSIFWEWASDPTLETLDASAGIADADFILIVFNGTRADYRGAFDAGIAIGLRKPVLVIQTRSRLLPLDYRQFTAVKTSLFNRDALAFHLDLFLASPPSTWSEKKRDAFMTQEAASPQSKRLASPAFQSDLERRAYSTIVAAGGSAIAEPRPDSDARFRPDLLAWLGHLDSELLDPTVIEVQHRTDLKTMRLLEDRLIGFMQSARVRTALVLTNSPVPPRGQQASPNIFWLTIDQFEGLMQTNGLGSFVRQMRNRIVHGAS